MTSPAHPVAHLAVAQHDAVSAVSLDLQLNGYNQSIAQAVDALLSARLCPICMTVTFEPETEHRDALECDRCPCCLSTWSWDRASSVSWTSTPVVPTMETTFALDLDEHDNGLASIKRFDSSLEGRRQRVVG